MTTSFGGQSMCGKLRRVVVCRPEVAGWSEIDRSSQWAALAYANAPCADRARAEHTALRQALRREGVEVIEIGQDSALSMDAVYTHDASFLCDEGIVILNMGKDNRAPEPGLHEALFREMGVPIVGRIEAPARVEGGDLVWLDSRTLLVGIGFRTNTEGAVQLARLLGQGVEVIQAPLPYGSGPQHCLHLMSLLSVLGPEHILADLPSLAVGTVELLHKTGWRLVEICGDERATFGCNVLSLGERRVLALEENLGTNRRMREAGFTVVTVSGRELACYGGGGPTCLTRPLLRDSTAD